MKTALIKIAYRRVINAASTGAVEKNIFHASWNEFLLKCQAYNPGGKYITFSELKANDGRANSLHYKTGFSVDHFITGLNDIIPGLKTTLGRDIFFETYQFEVIESDITDKSMHAVAVIYFTSTMTLLDNIEEYMLLAPGDRSGELFDKEGIEDTFLLQLGPGISISAYHATTSLFKPTTYN